MAAQVKRSRPLWLAGALLLSGCVTSGPVRRVLDEETSVLCYVTNTAMYCMKVTIDDSELDQNLAAAPSMNRTSK